MTGSSPLGHISMLAYGSIAQQNTHTRVTREAIRNHVKDQKVSRNGHKLTHCARGASVADVTDASGSMPCIPRRVCSVRFTELIRLIHYINRHTNTMISTVASRASTSRSSKAFEAFTRPLQFIKNYIYYVLQKPKPSKFNQQQLLTVSRLHIPLLEHSMDV